MKHVFLTDAEIAAAGNRCAFSNDKPFSQAARVDLPRALADLVELRRIVGEQTKALAAAEAALSEARERERWIPVSDKTRMPELGVNVPVINGGVLEIAHLTRICSMTTGCYWFGASDGKMLSDVTEWYNLPQTPAESGKGGN